MLAVVPGLGLEVSTGGGQCLLQSRHRRPKLGHGMVMGQAGLRGIRFRLGGVREGGDVVAVCGRTK